MKTISLNGIWQLSGKPQEEDNVNPIVLGGTVPGCVQLDLSREGYLPEDLFLGENIKETEKYEDWEWWYERTFTAPEERDRVFLVFEGVDCIAEYYLNGTKIGESENMFISHEFEISDYLKDGENTLTVHLKSAVIASHYEDYNAKSLFVKGVYASETPVRKAPHSFGWDIMPRAVTAGLWRDVKIEVRDVLYFSQYCFKTTLNSCEVFYEIKSKWSDFKDISIEFSGSCGEDSTFTIKEDISHNVGVLTFNIDNPKIWWPYGYGAPNIYDAKFKIYKNGSLVHEQDTHFALRTVELDRTDTTDGLTGKFRFLINGTEIMCKGSNWVPLDAFHSRDAERYSDALTLVKDIGCNILRCWGGNVYEDHTFYDFCDRNGVMIWQDFSMACRIYPETERFKKLIAKEVESVVRKLRNHPSIILWSGDNEIDQIYCVLGKLSPQLNRIPREIIPGVVELNDVSRPYLASSPYLTDDFIKEDNASAPSEIHLWGARDYYKADFYKQSKSHFVSETGYHGCPNLESIKKFITPESVWPYHNNPEWILHSTNQIGDPARLMLMEKQVRQLFGEVPTEAEEYILASQISQAEAKKFFIERIRIGRPRKTGIIWWNLIDGWPQMSDAVVDYYFSKKLAYNYIKRSQAPFVIAAGEIRNWTLPIYACNDTLTEKSGHLVIKDALTEEILLEKDFCAKANTTTFIDEFFVYYSEQKIIIMEWNIDGETGFNHYLCGYPPISLDYYKKIIKKYNL